MSQVSEKLEPPPYPCYFTLSDCHFRSDTPFVDLIKKLKEAFKSQSFDIKDNDVFCFTCKKKHTTITTFMNREELSIIEVSMFWDDSKNLVEIRDLGRSNTFAFDVNNVIIDIGEERIKYITDIMNFLTPPPLLSISSIEFDAQQLE
jgi:hypothetical protein